MTLGGYICVRNGDELDYCWREAVASLLPVCEQVIICDSDSTDGTREAADRLADKNPKIRVINMPWSDPKGDGQWWVQWLNFARSHLTTDLQITLDADEILSDHPDCHAAIQEAKASNVPKTFNRLNFWKDASHLIPLGHCCGKWVTRLGPANLWMPSDEGHQKGECPILDNAAVDKRLEIFHLGFLRRRDAFFRKAKVVLRAFFNNYDPRLAKLESAGKPLSDVEECEWTNQIVPWEGYMPGVVQRWLSARGHITNHYLPMNEREAYQRVRVVAPTHPDEPFNVLVVGDLGDIIHGMAIFRAMPGGVRLFARDANHICKRIVHRMPLIAPLLLSQGYVKGFSEHKDEDIHWNAGAFRSNHESDRSLMWAHWQHYRGHDHLPVIDVEPTEPWITGITPDPRANGRIVINRTPRYHNRHFRWKEIVQHYKERLLFIGDRAEHSTFCSQFGAVEYLPTPDLLAAAQVIRGSEMFIGNQSACFALAEAMKHPRLQEVCLTQPDVIVQRNAGFIPCADGGLDLPAMVGKPPLKLPPCINRVDYLKNPNTQPRTGWLCKGLRDVSYGTLKRRVIRDFKMDDATAHRAIFDELGAREPSYFATGQQHTELMKFKQAMEHAH